MEKTNRSITFRFDFEKNSLYDLNKKPKIHSCIFGLGGRNIYEEDISAIFKKLLSDKLKEKEYIGVR